MPMESILNLVKTLLEYGETKLIENENMIADLLEEYGVFEALSEVLENTVKPFVQSPPKRPRSVQFWEGDWTKGISVLDFLYIY